jgi:hypothetical protein
LGTGGIGYNAVTFRPFTSNRPSLPLPLPLPVEKGKKRDYGGFILYNEIGLIGLDGTDPKK